MPPALLFMKITFLIAFTTLSLKAQACSCTLPSISDSYKASVVVFYGKCLGAKQLMDFYDVDGKLFKAENFEVINAYKGISRAYTDLTNYRISVKSSCEVGNGCGICFERGKKYLVYAYRDLLSGHIITDGCTRSRAITNGDFSTMVSSGLDFGKTKKLNSKNWLRLRRSLRKT
jgi:hypothetical protein